MLSAWVQPLVTMQFKKTADTDHPGWTLFMSHTDAPELSLCCEYPLTASSGNWQCLVAQSRPTLCDPTHCSPPASSVHGISQARILEWLPFSPSGDPNPGIEPRCPTLQANSLPSKPPGKSRQLELFRNSSANLHFHQRCMKILLHMSSTFKTI